MSSGCPSVLSQTSDCLLRGKFGANFLTQSAQHGVAPTVHLALRGLEVRQIPFLGQHRQIEHPIGGDLTTAFRPKLIVARPDKPPVAAMPVNMQLVAHGPNGIDPPLPGQFLHGKNDQGFGPQAMHCPGDGDDPFLVTRMFASLDPANQKPAMIRREGRHAERDEMNGTMPLFIDQGDGQFPFLVEAALVGKAQEEPADVLQLQGGDDHSLMAVNGFNQRVGELGLDEEQIVLFEGRQRRSLSEAPREIGPVHLFQNSWMGENNEGQPRIPKHFKPFAGRFRKNESAQTVPQSGDNRPKARLAMDQRRGANQFGKQVHV